MFKEELQKNLFIENTKGALYFNTTYNYNLDVFAKASRFTSVYELCELFSNAYIENKYLLSANILYLLDIRNGKGERRLFKIFFKELCKKDEVLAKQILDLIPSLGRYDYLLVTYNTNLWDYTINLISNQLKSDQESLHPSLLAKWLPSIRTHNKDNEMAKELCKALGMTERGYRHLLSRLRSKLKIIEKNLSRKDYKINYEIIPSKAMKIYNNTFYRNDKDNYISYLSRVKEGKAKINTMLEPYDIIKQILTNKESTDLMDQMWKNQKDVFLGDSSNVLVIADTSGSMFTKSLTPIASSLGLAIYTAQNNKGTFHNMFLNFSDNPSLQEIKGEKLSEIVSKLDFHNWAQNTNINKALDLILKASINSLDDCPSELLIISDMEFDCSVKDKPNLYVWKEKYQKYNLKMPNIIFWNVNERTNGLPATKYEKGVALVSGFSKNIFKSILNLETYDPVKIMQDTLKPYLDMLK